MSPMPFQRKFSLLIAGAAALLVSACATTPAPMAAPSLSTDLNPMASTLSAGGAPAAAGYMLSGSQFAGDLRFVDADGHQARAMYAHAVDGGPTVHAELRPDRNWLSDGVRRFTGQSDRGVPITLELEAGPCHLGGRTFGRFVAVFTGRLAYEGCAEETGPQVSWSENLPQYLPMIDACMAATQTSSMAFVRGAGRMQVLHVHNQSDAPVVRMRFGDSGRWDCMLDGARASWRVVSDTAPERPSEADPVYFPGVMPDTGEACYVFERVRDDAGETLGALGYDACLGGSMAQLDTTATRP